MKALLLSAGLGTRLKPITNHTPKCLVPINGKPLLEYWLDNLTQIGIKEFIINTHYFSEQVEEYIRNSKYNENVRLVYEDELLLTGGTILANEKYFNDDSFLVVHADNLSFCDFDAFVKSHQSRKKQCEITMMTFTTDVPKSCGVIEHDENGIVIKFHEKVESPPSDLANAAVYIFEPTVIDYLRSLNKKEIDLSTEVIPNYLNKINTFHNNNYHRDIGTVESYALAQIEILEYLK